VFAVFVPIIANAETARKSWRPESVAAREIELSQEFEAKGLKIGSPVFLRVYKQTSEMELWIQRGPRYELFKIYRICRWSGGLGPKFYEGDRQSPEGVYRITTSDLIVNRRWDRAMNINYPNSFDQINGRSGSSILIHGGCGSIGCFAIQNQNVEEVYGAVRAALHNGQAYIPVLTLPFRFSALAPTKEDTLKMNEFWGDLRRADLLFERDRLPPVAWICDGRYYFSDRRGDRHRHAVHLPGCAPLDKPAGMRDASNLPKQDKPIVAASAESAQETVENEGQSRLLHVAANSIAPCPKKYPRCRVAMAALTKSAVCPLKYPRCRSFVGPEPKKSRSASRKSNIIGVKHSGHASKLRRL